VGRYSFACPSGYVGQNCEFAQLTANCTSCAPPAGTSVQAGINDCGPNQNDSCGASLFVPGGQLFFRYLRGSVTFDSGSPTTVSAFRLDKDEVTVGRFRKFVAAWNAGWRPALFSGKHAHLAGGQGLTGESGWIWGNFMPSYASPADWTYWLSTQANGTGTRSAQAGGSERLPQNHLSWYALYAFCS